MASFEDTIRDTVREAVAEALDAAGPAPLAVSTTEAARLLGCGPDHVRHLVRTGRLPRLPDLEHKVLIPVAAITRYVEAADQAPLGVAS